MVSGKLLVDDAPMLRLGLVVLSTVLARLFPNVQRLGGSCFGNTICYECLSSPLISENSLLHMEEIFRQLCDDLPDMRVVHQPRENVVAWAKHVKQHHLSLMSSSFPESIMQMVEIEDRYEYVGGDVSSNATPLKEVFLELEEGISESDSRTRCCRFYAVFPVDARKRRKMLRIISSRNSFPKPFSYREDLGAALPSTWGIDFVEIIYTWWRTAFLQLEGICTHSFLPQQKKKTVSLSAIQHCFWLDEHLAFKNALQLQQSKWFFDLRYRSFDSEKRKAWKWFSLSGGHKIFASLFCTKDRLVVELRSLVDVLVRFIGNCALSASARLTPTKNFCRALWCEVMEGCLSSFCFASDLSVSEIALCTWTCTDAMGRHWPLSSLLVVPVRFAFPSEKNSNLWAIAIDPVESIEWLGSHICDRENSILFGEWDRVHILAENDDALQILPALVRELDNGCKVSCSSVVGREQEKLSTASNSLFFSLADAVERRGFFWDKDDWKEMYFSDFVMRVRMSLFVKVIRREWS